MTTRADALAQLYGAPLGEFIAERKRLVAELKAAGDGDAAAEVGKLAKPSPAAWALNHVAREVPDELRRWLGAAETLRDASTRSAEVGGEALRDAMAAHRAATAQLRGVVREVSRPGGKALTEPMLDRVAALLQVATADAETAERLRLGILTEDKTSPPAVEVPAAAAPPKPAPDRRAADRERAERERRAELEARAGELREELGRVREQLEERKAAARGAVRRLEEARRALRRGESELSAAEAAVTESEDDIAAHERELASVREQLRG